MTLPLMRARSGLPVLTALTALSGSAALAGTTVVDPDVDAYDDLLNNPAYASVGTVTSGGGLGSGVYLGDGWVLTAAHVVDGSTSYTFTVEGESYAVSDVYLYDEWTGDYTEGTDLALVQLDTADVPVEAAVIYDPPVTEDVAKDALYGEVVTFVGYGQTGDGQTGSISGTAGEKHAGQNVLDAFGGDVLPLRGYDDSLFFVDFDDPSASSDGLWWSGNEALDLEYLIAPGDSGGGVFVDVDGVTYLVGINSFLVATDGDADADYGDMAGLTYVPDYGDWIVDVTGIGALTLDDPTSLPEPYGVLSTIPLLVALLVCRRRDVLA